MGPKKIEEREINEEIANASEKPAKTRAGVTRREWFKTAASGCAGLALGGFVDLEAVRASTLTMKLSDVNEFTTSCNFCSCGCGMVATVREDKLITMEGDFAPYCESRIPVCEGHIHVRDSHFAEPAYDPALSGAGEATAG